MALALAGCTAQETVAAYGAGGRTWQLTQLGPARFDAGATLRFPAPDRIAGQSPCGPYTGIMSAPYPWFEVDRLAATRAPCPDRAAETAYFDALRAMTQSEVSGDILILRDEAGREMVFRAAG